MWLGTCTSAVQPHHHVHHTYELTPTADPQRPRCSNVFARSHVCRQKHCKDSCKTQPGGSAAKQFQIKSTSLQ